MKENFQPEQEKLFPDLEDNKAAKPYVPGEFANLSNSSTPKRKRNTGEDREDAWKDLGH